MSQYDPVKEDKFSFGLWTVGNPGRDPFGDAVRPVQDPNHLVRKLAECGAWGVNLHDNDLVPFGSSAAERDRIVREFKTTLNDTGMCVPMATTNLFSHPIFQTPVNYSITIKMSGWSQPMTGKQPPKHCEP